MPARSSAASKALATRARATRRRGRVLEQAVREAVLVELGEVGYAALTMGHVARRAGTGKAPLYRRWPTKDDLLLHTVTHLPRSHIGDRVDTGDLRADLIELLSALAAAMARPTGRGIYRLVLELILDRRRHPELTAALLDTLLRPRLSAIMDALARAVDRGQIAPSAATEFVARAGPALVVQYQLEHDRGPTRDDITAIVDLLLVPALTAPSGHTAASSTG